MSDCLRYVWPKPSLRLTETPGVGPLPLLYVEQEWGGGQRGGRERGRGVDVKRGWELSRLYSQGTQ